MVRAILENRKTQTRRVVKNAHIITCDDRTGATDTKCPYGVPGDRLWVKESHQHSTDARGNSVIVYAADDAAFFLLAEDNGEGDLCGVGGKADRSRCYPIDRWRPSIHMHRWASRITLEVVSIRVERVQEISVSDALAEGMIPTWNGESSPGVPCPNELQQFRDLWIKINGPASWESNIWAWVVEFKRIGGSIGT